MEIEVRIEGNDEKVMLSIKTKGIERIGEIYEVILSTMLRYNPTEFVQTIDRISKQDNPSS